ncbi:MAG TPA: HPr-rel-A system PqqD family peptide chaperone [Casimicrobiaceae bacterium]|nr:HPr-rel-A system PqqD family peptide chaperone [Casimicrobiaceae bacterium]
MNRSPLWRPAARDALALREWDDEFVVYNDATGSTHHLNALGGDVLQALLSHPSGIDAHALVDILAKRIEVAPGLSLAAEVAAVLGKLRELDLASSVTG